MVDSVSDIIYFLVWPLPETAMSLVCNWLEGALPCTHYVMRSSPLCGVKVLPAQKLLDSTASGCDRQKRKNGTLAVYSSSRWERRVLQRRRQPTPARPIHARYIIYGQGGYLNPSDPKLEN